MGAQLKLLFILAHPDDESLAFGGTLAKYALEGIETSLIIATRGERGWRGPPHKHPGEALLGAIRENEARAASHTLGISRLEFLDYIDGDLDQAEVSEVVVKLVRLLRQIRPQVVVTFGPEGLYGHPDHIAISQFSSAALFCAADPTYPHASNLAPHYISKFYYGAATSEWFERYMPIFGDLVMYIDGAERRALPGPTGQLQRALIPAHTGAMCGGQYAVTARKYQMRRFYKKYRRKTTYAYGDLKNTTVSLVWSTVGEQ